MNWFAIHDTCRRCWNFTSFPVGLRKGSLPVSCDPSLLNLQEGRLFNRLVLAPKCWESAGSSDFFLKYVVIATRVLTVAAGAFI